MYNVLEALRAGRELTPKEQAIHDNGLVSVLRQLHDELDAAVADAYGWPASLSDAEILRRLVALNAERAAEEAAGKVRWLRPDYQMRNAKCEMGNDQTNLVLPEGNSKFPIPNSKFKQTKLPWPKSLSERVRAIEEALSTAPATPADLAKRFSRAKESDIAEILETLATLGRATKNGKEYNG